MRHRPLHEMCVRSSEKRRKQKAGRRKEEEKRRVPALALFIQEVPEENSAHVPN